MRRLIDADALVEKYGDWYTEEGQEEGYIGTLKDVVNLMPSAQPEIIRCKECKHWRSSDHTCHEHSLVSPMLANDFCSKAERMEE